VPPEGKGEIKFLSQVLKEEKVPGVIRKNHEDIDLKKKL